MISIISLLQQSLVEALIQLSAELPVWLFVFFFKLTVCLSVFLSTPLSFSSALINALWVLLLLLCSSKCQWEKKCNSELAWLPHNVIASYSNAVKLSRCFPLLICFKLSHDFQQLLLFCSRKKFRFQTNLSISNVFCFLVCVSTAEHQYSAHLTVTQSLTVLSSFVAVILSCLRPAEVRHRNRSGQHNFCSVPICPCFACLHCVHTFFEDSLLSRAEVERTISLPLSLLWPTGDSGAEAEAEANEIRRCPN